MSVSPGQILQPARRAEWRSCLYCNQLSAQGPTQMGQVQGLMYQLRWLPLLLVAAAAGVAAAAMARPVPTLGLIPQFEAV